MFFRENQGNSFIFEPFILFLFLTRNTLPPCFTLLLSAIIPPVMAGSSFVPFQEKMQAAGLSEAAIKAFERNYNTLVAKESVLISQKEISSVENLALFDALKPSLAPATQELLSQTVIIKLNGGLGTSMGLQKAKSLLPVKGKKNFLDLTLQQILSLREKTGAQVRLLLMNSFSTSADTLAHLQAYAQDGFGTKEEVEMLQNKVPKIDAQSLTPALCPSQPDLEWCPPGHGDIYAALLGSGWLDKLLAAGVKYAFISNSDNLGAVLDRQLLSWFAQSQAPFAMEVTRRTEADKKGGHLAKRQTDGALILREIAQCPPEAEEQELFQKIDYYQYFNTNNIWLRLDALKETLEKNQGVLPLPMIKNEKTLDPRDKSSAKVYQLEVAMGAGIECFEGACAIEVSRERFAPVKTSGDLLALRSDAYIVTEEGQVQLAPERQGKPPLLILDKELHALVDSLDTLGLPSLLHVEKLVIEGDVRFKNHSPLKGSLSFKAEKEKGPLFVE